jgi:XTP/dITP diphosphohydrolase
VSRIARIECYTWLYVRVLLATANPGKIRELHRILGSSGIDIVGLEGHVANDEIETGITFSENALLKARYYHKLRRIVTIADDSGLEVEALDGAPGIYSARFGGPGLTDAERTGRLLEALNDVPPERRKARFVCVAAIVWDAGELTFEGHASGTLLTAPRGRGGFGYDPIFFYEPLDRTFAELDPAKKARVSHRGKAFGQLAAWIRKTHLLDSPNADDRIIYPA